MVWWPPEFAGEEPSVYQAGRLWQFAFKWPIRVIHRIGELCQELHYYDCRSNERVLGVFMSFEQSRAQTVEQEEAMNKDALKKAKSVAQGKGSDVVLKDPQFEKQFPNLAAFMLLVADSDGPRELSKVQIFADQDAWRASLVDYENRQTLYTTLEGPELPFEALERALTKAKVDWRPWDRRKSKGEGKKGKA